MKYSLIRDTYHGFFQNCLCSTYLLEFLLFVANYVDQGYPIDVMYLDFQKAFDKVPHIMLKINFLGINKLQLDLHHLCKWCQDWLMLFNVGKCKVMHIGFNNIKAKYKMSGKFLEEVFEERDLGVIIRNDLKCRSPCMKAAKTAIGS